MNHNIINLGIPAESELRGIGIRHVVIVRPFFKIIMESMACQSLVKTLKHLAKALRVDAAVIVPRDKNMTVALDQLFIDHLAHPLGEDASLFTA
jgi:hypothetical protein